MVGPLPNANALTLNVKIKQKHRIVFYYIIITEENISPLSSIIIWQMDKNCFQGYFFVF